MEYAYRIVVALCVTGLLVGLGWLIYIDAQRADQLQRDMTAKGYCQETWGGKWYPCPTVTK